jgi:hypothetical protein
VRPYVLHFPATELTAGDCSRPRPSGGRPFARSGRLRSGLPKRQTGRGQISYFLIWTPTGVRTRLFVVILGVAGKDWLLFKKGLRDVVAVSAPPNKYLPTVRQLANIDLNALAPLGGRWRDPGLPGLVATLVPIWKRVTGRTAGLVSVGKDCETKKCLFANWLGEMLGKIGIRPPPVGRVVDIVRAEN